MKTLIGIMAMVVIFPGASSAQVQNPPPSVMTGIRIACFSPQWAFSESAEGKAAIARLIDTQRFIQDAQAELLLNLDAGVVAWFEPSLDLTAEITNQIVASR